MSEIAKRIAQVVSAGLALHLRGDGWKKQGMNFRRVDRDVLRVVNVQSSSANIGDDGKFTLNLGIYAPGIVALLKAGGSPLEAPKEYECHRRTRIGSLRQPEAEAWWIVSPSTDIPAVAAKVAEAYATHGRPWFDQVGTLACLAEEPSMEGAAAALLLGRRDDAARAIATVIETCPPRASRLLATAQAFQLRHAL